MNYRNFYELSTKEQEELKSLEDNEVEVALMEAGGDNTTKIIDSKVNLYNLKPEMYESINSVSVDNNGYLSAVRVHDMLHGWCCNVADELTKRDPRFERQSLNTEDGRLIHEFAVANIEGRLYFADARGITPNWDEFMKEYTGERLDKYMKSIGGIDLTTPSTDYYELMENNCIQDRNNAGVRDCAKHFTATFNFHFNNFKDQFDLDKCIQKDFKNIENQIYKFEENLKCTQDLYSFFESFSKIKELEKVKEKLSDYINNIGKNNNYTIIEFNIKDITTMEEYEKFINNCLKDENLSMHDYQKLINLRNEIKASERNTEVR